MKLRFSTPQQDPAKASIPVATRLCWAAASIVLAMAAIFGLGLLLNLPPSLPAAAQTTKVGLVADVGGIADKSFNQMAYEGLLRAQTDYGVIGTVYTSTSSAEYAAKLAQCVQDGNDLCIPVGFAMADATRNAAATYPTTQFAIVDYEYGLPGLPSYLPNLRSLMFAEDQVGYLAGTLAGKMTQTGLVGAVAGMDIPPVVRFATGYRNGAQCASLTSTVLISYTPSFVDPAQGAQIAQNMLGRGADVIFGVGGSTGNGGVLTATQSGAWGIGVDADQYVTLFENGAVPGADKLLTSAMKRVDHAVYSTIGDVVSGTFNSGTIRYTLADGGVGLAPFHEADPAVPQAARDALTQASQGIISGTINVYAPCRALSMGLVADVGGIADKSFNQMAYEGLLRAQNDYGVVGTVYSSTSTEDYATKLAQCADDGNQLCISVGWTMGTDTYNAAATYPTTQFAIVDNDYNFSTGYLPNLRGLLFAEDQVGYLAGTLAGKMTRTGVVGAVAGMQIPPVERFALGYRNGAQCASLTSTVLVSYTPSFTDPALGAQIAKNMLGRGADVIFGVGGDTGNGGVLTATQSGAWGIGVDADQYLTLFQNGAVPGADKLLTSAMKRVDNAVYSTIGDVVSDTFTSGGVVYTLADGGVGLAPFHAADPAIPQAARDALTQASQGIINGTINVYAPCRVMSTVGLVADRADIYDTSFNQMAYEGLLRAQSTFGVSSTVYAPASSDYYAAKLAQCALEGNRLCISVGFMMGDATHSAATTYTTTKFAIVDNEYGLPGLPGYLPNLRSLMFAEDQVGYLAGTLAGKMTRTGVIGAVAGMEIPPVVRFTTSYRNGAQCASLTNTVLISYTPSFTDTALGAQVAQNMLGRGVDVIFGVGGDTGNGGVLTATQSGAWGIGVDVDEYLRLFQNGAVPGADKLLTSAVKRVDNAVYSTIADMVSGKFTSGIVRYTLADGGVGLAPFHAADPAIPQAARNALAQATQGIISGTVNPNQACPALLIDFTTGAPGSYFTLTGLRFPPTSTVTLLVNGHALTTTLAVDANGGFVLVLDTQTLQADPGHYTVTAQANGAAGFAVTAAALGAQTSFVLQTGAPLHPKPPIVSPVLAVPQGVAEQSIYLPLVRR